MLTIYFFRFFFFQGLKSANKLDIFFHYLPSIIDFLRRSTEDSNRSGEVLKSAIGLLGDLGQAFGNKVLPVYNMPFVASLIQEGSQNGSDTQDVAEWAQSVSFFLLLFLGTILEAFLKQILTTMSLDCFFQLGYNKRSTVEISWQGLQE